MSSQIFDWKPSAEPCQTLFNSLSLIGVRLGPKQARRVNVTTASLSLAERWTITEIRRPSNSVLTYSLLTDVLPL